MPPPALPVPPKLIGNSFSFSPVTVMDCSALSVLSISAADDTVIDSVAAPTCSLMFRLSVLSISTASFGCSSVLNPTA